MGLKAEIQEAAKQALKEREQVALSTLRLLLSALHNEEIRLRRDGRRVNELAKGLLES